MKTVLVGGGFGFFVAILCKVLLRLLLKYLNFTSSFLYLYLDQYNSEGYVTGEKIFALLKRPILVYEKTLEKVLLLALWIKHVNNVPAFFILSISPKVFSFQLCYLTLYMVCSGFLFTVVSYWCFMLFEFYDLS